MEYIELVIKIPEYTYKEIVNDEEYGIERVRKAVINGTPLPKGHGDLKDMSNLPYIFDLTRDDTIYSGKDIERAINSMTSIIEADKEEQE